MIRGRQILQRVTPEAFVYLHGQRRELPDMEASNAVPPTRLVGCHQPFEPRPASWPVEHVADAPILDAVVDDDVTTIGIRRRKPPARHRRVRMCATARQEQHDHSSPADHSTQRERQFHRHDEGHRRDLRSIASPASATCRPGRRQPDQLSPRESCERSGDADPRGRALVSAIAVGAARSPPNRGCERRTEKGPASRRFAR